MKSKRSLRLRQLLIAVITIIVALLISLIGFTYLFERHVERRFHSELDVYLHNIAASLIVGPDNKLHLSTNVLGPQFNVPLSGFYWRVYDLETKETLRSRSLWDSDLPNDNNNDQDDYFIVSRQIALSGKDNNRDVRIDVALSRNIIVKTRNEFARDLSLYLGLLGIVLFGLMVLQIELGLWPLRRLKRDVEKLTHQMNARMEDDYHKEVEPLTQTINDLLETRMKTVEKADKRAADLAHGLKSPLAALRNQANQLAEQGNERHAQILRDLSISLEHQINRELTRARAENVAQKGFVSCEVLSLVQQLVRVLKSTHFGENIQWHINIAHNATMPLDASDLAEALGPLMENAARHAKTQVQISFANQVLMIEDDGLGMTKEQCETALTRGVRYDEKASSTGLGLAIAHDVLEPYGYRLKLEKSVLGGLQVKIYKS